MEVGTDIYITQLELWIKLEKYKCKNYLNKNLQTPKVFWASNN